MGSPPSWLSLFTDKVTTSIHAHNVLSPLGCHFQEISGVWEITIFASRTEIVGGSQDGRSRHSPFSVDVANVLSAFSDVENIGWQAHRLDRQDDLGPHLSVDGTVENHRVWLRVTSAAPERFEPGRRALVNQQGFEEVW